ncbi:unnamed protein product, partial [Laminaria digitata]
CTVPLAPEWRLCFNKPSQGAAGQPCTSIVGCCFIHSKQQIKSAVWVNYLLRRPQGYSYLRCNVLTRQAKPSQDAAYARSQLDCDERHGVRSRHDNDHPDYRYPNRRRRANGGMGDVIRGASIIPGDLSKLFGPPLLPPPSQLYWCWCWCWCRQLC